MSLQALYCVILSILNITFLMLNCSDLFSDNSEKVEKLKEKDDQDIYVPKFFFPPISNRSIVHAVDKEYANVESVNEAQVCVGESFLSKPECLDSESKVMGSMEIERSIASGKNPKLTRVLSKCIFTFESNIVLLIFTCYFT